MKTKMIALVLTFFLFGSVYSQDQSIPLIGAKAPSFTAESTNGTLTFPEDFGNSWKILFSHPQDFTPVCSSELLELAYIQDVFADMNVKIAIISTDNVDRHNEWKAYLEEINYKDRGTQKISFPLFDDQTAVASKKYGMVHPIVSTNKDIRGVFIIDSENIVRSINFYPIEVGRNFQEITRVINALQATKQAKVLTPANWKSGDDVMVPYYPYTQEQLANNPALKDQYYSVANRMWFKKVEK